MCSPFSKFGLFLIVIVTLALLCAPVVLAQSRGFSGRVTNDKGEPVVAVIGSAICDLSCMMKTFCSSPVLRSHSHVEAGKFGAQHCPPYSTPSSVV